MSDAVAASDWLARALSRDVEEVRAWDPAASLRLDLGLDSLDLMQALLVLEHELGRSFPAELLDTIDSVNELSHWIEAASPDSGDKAGS